MPQPALTYFNEVLVFSILKDMHYMYHINRS